jgi:short-subunit dehydrogenase
MLHLKEKYGPWALVAGGSEGLGRAFSEQLAAAGFNVVVLARRQNLLDETVETIRKKYGVETRAVSLDLGLPDVVERLDAAIGDLDIGLLVYDACHSFIGNFMEETSDSKMETINVNCRGTMLLSSFFAERFLKRDKARHEGRAGGILLMSSMAGFQGTSMTLSYAATKAFVTVLGEGLWRELGAKDIDVLVNIAGAVLTPNFKAGTPEAKWKASYPSEPEDVAREGLLALDRGKMPSHIAGGTNRLVHAVFGRLSRRFAVHFMSVNTENLYK